MSKRRAAALVEKQKAWDKWDNPSQPAPPAMVEGEVATLVSDMAAEITRLRAALKWNIERDGDDLLICEGDHERHEDCTMQRWVRAEKVATARQAGMEKAAKIGDRHIEIGEVLSETEADKRLADNIKMQVGAMKQVVDAIRAAAKEGK